MRNNSVLSKPQKHSATNYGDKEMQSKVVGQEGPLLPPSPHIIHAVSWWPANPVRNGTGRGGKGGVGGHMSAKRKAFLQAQ